MERLTETNNVYTHLRGLYTVNSIDNYNLKKLYDNLYERLLAYENTGKTPEEVQAWVAADKGGLLKIFPCEVGDMVWIYFDYSKRIVSFIVEEISINGVGVYINCHRELAGDGMEEVCISVDDIGKILFFTELEAETALKEMESKGNE